MPFEKGNNLGGRKKGTPNKINKKLKESLMEIIENNMAILDDDLDRMKPVERVQAMIQLMSFVLPKQKAVDMSIDGKVDFQPAVFYINEESK